MANGQKEFHITTTELRSDFKQLFFGQRLYAIVLMNAKDWSEPCPVCDDTKKVVIKNIECQCPYCSSSVSRTENNHICIHKYGVTDIYINKIEFSATSTKSYYAKQKDICASFITYNGCFNYKDNCDRRNEYSRRINTSRIFTNLDKIKTPEDAHNEMKLNSDIYFFSKTQAQKFVNLLNQYEFNRLSDFNDKHNTNYLYTM